MEHYGRQEAVCASCSEGNSNQIKGKKNLYSEGEALAQVAQRGCANFLEDI